MTIKESVCVIPALFSLFSFHQPKNRTKQNKTKTLRANKLTTIAAARTNPKLKWNDSKSANEIWRCHVAYITLGKRYILCVATKAKWEIGEKKKGEIKRKGTGKLFVWVSVSQHRHLRVFGVRWSIVFYKYSEEF